MNLRLALPALVLLTASTACRKMPLTPEKPLPAGTLMLRFTRAVKGPLELNMDGVRVPVAQGRKGGIRLVVQGLAPGKHHYFLSSPLDAFGPDSDDIWLPEDRGEYRIVLSQRFQAELYGKAAAAPAAEGLPGVTAALQTK
ncbi:MAG TPA: hypothetical protein VJ600_05435 [Holophagaceae bacterium]|nr:hypothetical protein [Holophagaceae bacterium]